jgi:hypothetical protein
MLPTTCTLRIQHIHICSTALSVQKSSKGLVQFLLSVSHQFRIFLHPTTRTYISYSLKASGDDMGVRFGVSFVVELGEGFGVGSGLG